MLKTQIQYKLGLKPDGFGMGERDESGLKLKSNTN